MSQFIQVITTTSSKEQAETISRALLESRLAGCVQILGPISSRYWWDGKIESADEWLCIIKTKKYSFSDVEKIIKDNHSYDVPEILAFEVTEGSHKYLEWLNKELRQSS